MALDNSQNSTDESGNNKKNDNSKNLTSFLDNFCENKIKDESSKNDFLDSIFEKWIIPTDEIKDELKSDSDTVLIWWKPKYEWVELKDIKISDLKQKTLKDYVPLKNKRQKVENILAIDYDLSSEQKKKLEKWIKDLEDKDLDKLINEVINKEEISEWWDRDIFDTLKKVDNKRDKFFKTIFWKELLNKKEKEVFINHFNFSSLSEEKIKMIFKNEPNVLESLKFLDKRDKSKELTTTDVWFFIDLIKSNHLSENEKKENNYRLYSIFFI